MTLGSLSKTKRPRPKRVRTIYPENEKLLKKERLNKLATPKDRLIRGKTFVELQTKFPDDKILRQMLVNEFANDRIVKKPLEYDFVDSEEEDRIKMRENKKAGKRSKSDGKEEKKKGPWVTEDAKEAMRAKELIQRFDELSKRYNKEKEMLILGDLNAEKVLKKQQQQFEEFVQKATVKYRRNILAKNKEEVPTENQFLSDVRRLNAALQRSLQELQGVRGERVWPSQVRRKQAAEGEEFPVDFQALFLQGLSCLGQEVAETVGQQGRLLGAGRQLRVEEQEGDGREQVEERTRRLAKPAKVICNDRREFVWEKEEYRKDRENILMTFDEVENCTFHPTVRSKMPPELKISKENPDMLYGKPETNMKKKVDEYLASKEYKRALMIGVFNKAMKEFREGRPINAYKTLHAQFNLDQIRTFYNKNDPGPSEGTALYSILHPEKQQKFKDDEEEPVEKVQINLNPDDANDKEKGAATSGSKDGLLRDVYELANIIEQHQATIERQIKIVAKSKKQMEKKTSKKGRESTQSMGPTKTTMCPLGYAILKQ